MPRTLNPKPHQEIPPFEVLTTLHSFFEGYPDDPFGKHMLQRLTYGKKLWKDEVEDDWKLHEANADLPAPTLKNLLSPIKARTRTLFDLLKQEGHEDKVKEVKKKYTDPYDIAVNTVAACRELKLDATASVIAALEKELKPYAEAKARVDAGGHPVFEKKLAASITKLWVITDDGFDSARVVLRNRAIYVHPIFELDPRVKSPLRPQVGPPKPATAPARSEAKSSKGTGKNKGTKPNGKDAKGKGADPAKDQGSSPPPANGSGPGTGGTPPPSPKS